MRRCCVKSTASFLRCTTRRVSCRPRGLRSAPKRGFTTFWRPTAPRPTLRPPLQPTRRPAQCPPPAGSKPMSTYTPPLRDMQSVLHEVLGVSDEFKALPAHAEVDAQTIDAVLAAGGRFAAEVTFPLNPGGDAQGCQHNPSTHAVTTPTGFKQAYAQYVEGGWAALS